MAIINQKDIYDSSKGNPLEPLIKSLDVLNKEIVKLTSNSKSLEKELREVQNTSDGKEAKKLVETTKKLNTETAKLKTTKTATVRVNEQILKTRAKLSESRAGGSAQLAKLKVQQQEQNKLLREQARQSLGLGKQTNGLVKSFKSFGLQMVTSLGLMGGLLGAFKGIKNIIGATAEGQIFLAKVTGATSAVTAELRDIIIDTSKELISWVQLLNTDASEAAKSFGNLIKDNLIARWNGFKTAIEAGNTLFRGEFKQALKETADGLIAVATGTENATEKTKEFINQMKIQAAFGAAIAGSEKKLALDRSRFAIREAKDIRTIADLRAKAADKENFSAKEREGFILRAIDLNRNLSANNQRFANQELALQQAVFNANKSNITEEIELNKLIQRSDEIKALSLKKEKSLLAELTTAKREAAAIDKAIIDQRNNDLVQNLEFTTTAKDTEVENINELNAARDQYAKNNADRWQAEREATLQAQQDYKILSSNVSNAAAQAGNAIGQLMAQGLLTFKEFGKILLLATLDLVQRQINIYFAQILAREISTKGPIGGIISTALVAGLINGALQAAKAGIQNFNEGTESVPGQGNKDTVPAMLTPGERVVPAEINKQLAGIPNSELPRLLSGSQRDGLIASLLMSGNKTNNKMLTALLNLGYTYDRNGQRHIVKSDGSRIEKFNI